MIAKEIEERFDIQVCRCSQLSEHQFSQVHILFASIYRDANHNYLDKSLQTLGYIAIARDGDTVAGFALGDCIQTEIPGVDGLTTVILGGISCISIDYRRQGLFGYLEKRATTASGLVKEDTRVLGCGRMAHPAGFSSMSRNPTVVPKYNVAISDWQKKVGLKIAELYGVSINPNTFVVQGSGQPIGYANITVDVPDADWQVFQGVNRDKGDSLLGISWSPDAPPGW